MFEPLVEVAKWLYSLVPHQIRPGKIKMNYIKVHYLYLVSMSLSGSIILYGSGFMPYIDAFFFGICSSTQSGLNTINVNKMFLYQQIMLMLVACITNPIFINTVVVFVRLYWFEKRFKKVVKDARAHRRHGRTITRTRSQMKEDGDPGDLESGAHGQQIRVLHDSTEPNGMTGTMANSEEAEKFKEKKALHTNGESDTETPESSNKSSNVGVERGEGVAQEREAEEDDGKPEAPDSPASAHHLGLNPNLHHRDIVFADEVESSDHAEESPDSARLPEPQDVSKHIEFLERQQRNARQGSVLHIPGPRAFDRGELPKELEDSDDEKLQRPQTRNTLEPIPSVGTDNGIATELNGDDHPERSGIRFDDKEHPGRRQQGDTMDRTATANSRFGVNRLRNTTSPRHTRSNSHRLNLSEARGSLGRTFSTLTTVKTRDNKMSDPMPYLSWQATTGRNSAFHGLSQEQREELGGIEYRALKTLAKILVMYYVGFHFFGLCFNLPFILHTQHYKNVVVDYGNNPSWWAIFTSASLFNDLGLTLTPDSMVSFQRSTLVLTIGSFLIVIGNTGFPVMLRFVIWVASQIAPHGSALWEELRFLLDHPRRSFTLLFPSKATWWLFWILFLLNGIDLIFFIILDLNDPLVTGMPPGYRVLNGWFQAASTRTAGFSSVSLSHLHPAIQVSYMIMMYISVFPIAISVRRTNVYEEKSLGIYAGEEAAADETDPSYVGQHLRRQLSFDLWYVFLGFFIIAIVEGDRISDNKDIGFTMYAVLFEIVSAYGTVGLSLGYPDTNPSFSAQFKVISKLVICAMMIRGRHRGLPYAVDRAILLPSENLQKKEAEDADRRYRRNSIFAEEYEAQALRRGETWSGAAFDGADMSKHHLSPTNSPQSAFATGRRGSEPATLEPEKSVRRVTSGISQTSANRPRRRSLSRVIVGGLSAGPTLSKHD